MELELIRVPESQACCRCKFSKEMPGNENLSKYCEKHKAVMGFIWALGMRCDAWEKGGS